MDDVEEPVQPQEEHDVGGDILHVIKFGYHVQLGQDCEGLHPPRECLEDSIQWPLGVDEEAQDGGS